MFHDLMTVMQPLLLLKHTPVSKNAKSPVADVASKRHLPDLLAHTFPVNFPNSHVQDENQVFSMGFVFVQLVELFDARIHFLKHRRLECLFQLWAPTHNDQGVGTVRLIDGCVAHVSDLDHSVKCHDANYVEHVRRNPFVQHHLVPVGNHFTHDVRVLRED